MSTTLQYLLPIVYILTFDRTLAYAILNRANYTDFETKNKTESKIVVTALTAIYYSIPKYTVFVSQVDVVVAVYRYRKIRRI